MKSKFRCKCPITSALDVLGDKWSLVLIKQMLFEGKTTFKDFAESPESFATNILSSRLKMLEEFEIIEKIKLPTNKKTNIYLLTEKGVSLTPVLMELTFWSKNNLVDFVPDLYTSEEIKSAEENKEASYEIVKERYEAHKQIILKSD